MVDHVQEMNRDAEKKEREVCAGVRDKIWTMLTLGQENKYTEEKK